MSPRAPRLPDVLSRVTAALLAVAVGLVVVLMYRARAEALTHRGTAERALREYAAFAAWELTNQARAALQTAMYAAFTRAVVEAADPTARTPLAAENFAASVRQEGADCACMQGARRYYRLDLRDSSLAAYPSDGSGSEDARRLAAAVLAAARQPPGDAPPAGERVLGVVVEDTLLGTDASPSASGPASPPGWRSDRARDSAEGRPERIGGGPLRGPAGGRDAGAGFIRSENVVRQRTPDGEVVVRLTERARAPSVTITELSGRPTALVQEVVRDASGAPVAVYGLAADPSRFFAPIFAQALARDRLLPPSVTRGRSARSIFSVRVTGPAGADVFSAGAAPSAYAAADTLPARYGGVRVRVALNDALAEQLLVGGLPRSRLPVLLAVLALTIGLMGTTTVQLRRQATLARMRTDFVAGVSHELRTPLAQIRLLAELLTMGHPPTEEGRRESARIIDQEARRLSHLVQNVLSFSRTERRATSVAPVPTDLGDEVAQVLQTFLPLARAEGVAVEPALRPGVVAMVDPFALRQIVINLLDNAVRYGGRGRTVCAAVEVRDGMGCVVVADEGPGVPEREQQKVWEPYYRLERDAAETRGGSGIGLSVVRDLVTRHDGRVSVRNRAQGGAEFAAAFPLHVPMEIHEPAAAAAPAQRRAPPPSGGGA